MYKDFKKWWKKNPNVRAAVRIAWAAVLSYVVSGLANHSFSDWKSFVYGAGGAAVTAVLSYFTPMEPSVGLKSKIYATRNTVLPSTPVNRAMSEKHRVPHRWGEKSVRLGKHPKKTDSRTLQLAKYIVSLPAPPKAVIRSTMVHLADWGMMANDKLGDCTCAALGHANQTWTGILGKVQTPLDQAVVNLYWATGNTDDGRNMLDVLNYAKKHRLFRHVVSAFTEIQVHDHDALKHAIDLFGGAYVGVLLPNTAKSQPDIWDVVQNAGRDGEPGSWGGHAIWVVDYDEQYLTVVTWGQLVRVTWAFWDKYGEEAYAILDSAWLKHGKTIHGFNRKQLLADLAAI